MEDTKISISVVIPTYNEERRIVNSLSCVREFLEEEGFDYEVIISDDGSTDSTKMLVEDFIKNNKKFRLLKNPHKGKGPAVRAGILNAKKDYVLFTDADLSTPVKELKRLLLWLTEYDYDIAIASREGLGALRKNEPYIRHIMGRVFNLLIQMLALPGINDTQCGFKLFKRKVAREIFSKFLVYSGKSNEKAAFLGSFDVEALVIAKLLKYKVKEVPVTWAYNETTRLSHIRDSVKMLKDVIRIRINAIKGKYN